MASGSSAGAPLTRRLNPLFSGDLTGLPKQSCPSETGVQVRPIEMRLRFLELSAQRIDLRDCSKIMRLKELHLSL